MKDQILLTTLLAASFLALFGIAELLHHKAKVKVELTRKLVHLGTGFLTLLFPLLLKSHWLVLFLCASFAVLLFLSLRFNLLRSINAIDRVSYGSLLYPVSVYICYLAYEFFGACYTYFYVPILVLAISDPLAALCGKKWPLGRYRVGEGYKTIMGSSVFFISAALTAVSILKSNSLCTEPVKSLAFAAVAVAGIATLAEALSRKGFDNLTIPLSALAVLAFGNF